MLNKYCVPDLTNVDPSIYQSLLNFTTTFNTYINVDKLSDYIMDLVHVWQVMLITLGTAVILGMIYMILIRCFAGVIIWFSILGIMAILGAGGYWVYLYRTHYETTDNNYKYL